jgi:hypothetical protein
MTAMPIVAGRVAWSGVWAGTLLGAAAAMAAIALIPACSGAAGQDVLDTTPAGASASGGTATSGGTSGSSGATSSGTSGNGTSGAATSGGSSGTTADASVDASPLCASEIEPNDSRDTANVLATSLCGAIQPDSESDFLTFLLAQTTTSMQITFTGQVTLRIDVNGQTVTLGNGLSPMVPFEQNRRYTIEIKATVKGASIPWRVNLIEK